MKLTTRQREILTGLRDDPEVDLVESKGDWWFGDSKTNRRTGKFLLVNFLIQPEQNCNWGEGGYVSYEISHSGRQVLDDPSYDPTIEMLKLNRKNLELMKGRTK